MLDSIKNRYMSPPCRCQLPARQLLTCVFDVDSVEAALAECREQLIGRAQTLGEQVQKLDEELKQQARSALLTPVAPSDSSARDDDMHKNAVSQARAEERVGR